MKSPFQLWMFYCLLFGLFFGAASGYQILGVSRDYLNYFEFFDIVRYSPDISDVDYRFEPAFTAVVYGLVSFQLGNELIYGVIAGSAVCFKYSLVLKSRGGFLALWFFTFYFFARYLFLFEMTVLRATCAFALVFYVFFRKNSDKYNLKDILILVLAFLFHYSAILFLPIYFVRNLTRVKIILISFLLFFFIFFAKSFVFDYLSVYLTVFSTYSEFGKATILPIPFFIDICFVFVMLFFWGSNDISMRYCLFGFLLSVAMHFSLIDYSMFAGRFREILSVFILIYIYRAMIGNCSKVKNITYFYVYITGFLHLYVSIFHDPLLT